MPRITACYGKSERVERLARVARVALPLASGADFGGRDEQREAEPVALLRKVVLAMPSWDLSVRIRLSVGHVS